METDNASPEVSFNEESKEVISNQVIGPQAGAIRCLFKVSQRNFIGQQLVNPERLPEWLIRADTLEEFRANLWELARPYAKQAVQVETDQNGHLSVCWTDPVRPAFEHANQYITFNNRKSRRTYSWDSLNCLTIARWDSCNMDIAVFIFMHTTAIASRHINELVQQTLIAPRKPKPVTASAKPRKHLPEGSDGYNFQDEVRALRETFLQMRDLMHILDNRISMLEEKCDQTLQHEPLISMNDAAAAGAVGEMVDLKPYGNPDPLHGEEMKEETLEDDDDEEAFYQYN